MALWSASFGAVVSLAAAACRACVGARSVLWLHGTAMVLGPVLGFGCFALATLVRPGWVVAFPVFSCWAYGGFLALLGAGATTRSAKSMWATAGLGTLASVALVWSHAVLRRLG